MTATASTARPRAAGDSLARLLRLDALASGAMGLVLAVGGAALDGPLGPRPAFLVPLGLFLVLYAAALLVLARRPSRAGAAVVVAGNLAWVALSVVTVAAGWLDLTALGTILALAQAGAVAVLAELQLI